MPVLDARHVHWRQFRALVIAHGRQLPHYHSCKALTIIDSRSGSPCCRSIWNNSQISTIQKKVPGLPAGHPLLSSVGDQGLIFFFSWTKPRAASRVAVLHACTANAEQSSSGLLSATKWDRNAKTRDATEALTQCHLGRLERLKPLLCDYRWISLRSWWNFSLLFPCCLRPEAGEDIHISRLHGNKQYSRHRLWHLLSTSQDTDTFCHTHPKPEDNSYNTCGGENLRAHILMPQD